MQCATNLTQKSVDSFDSEKISNPLITECFCRVSCQVVASGKEYLTQLQNLNSEAGTY